MPPLPAVFAVEGAARDYAWGSPTAIPRMLGAEPDGRPLAELWFGAHSDDPSRVPDHGVELDRLIESHAEELLGAAVVGRFGPRLPFLLKVLAAETALSIQVHPDLAQARSGFAAEEAAGVPRDAPDRNYRDANHKPELLCALTPFEALCGFRPVDGTLRLMDALDVPELAEVRALVAGPDGLRAAFTHLLELTSAAPLVAAVVAAAAGLPPGSEWSGAARAVTTAGTDFPGDVGAVLALLLNDVRLQPGDAIYLGAGNVHAYLRGTGVELMANSDNVLRCGLTPKHVDVPELLKITDFAPLTEPRCAAREVGCGRSFAVPVADFALSSLDVRGSCTLDATGPHLVLCTSGSVRVEALGDAVELSPGHAAFVIARAGPLTVAGSGQAFAATVGS